MPSPISLLWSENHIENVLVAWRGRCNAVKLSLMHTKMYGPMGKPAPVNDRLEASSRAEIARKDSLKWQHYNELLSNSVIEQGSHSVYSRIGSEKPANGSSVGQCGV